MSNRSKPSNGSDVSEDTPSLYPNDASMLDGSEYRLLFEDNPLPMWVYDLETMKFLAVNHAAMKQYGYAEKEFLAMTIKDIRPGEDIGRLLASVDAVRTKGEWNVSRGWRHLRKNGDIIDVEISGHPVIWGNRPAEMITAYDISPRVRMESELKERVKELAFLHTTARVLQNEVDGISETLQQVVDAVPEGWQYPELAAARIIVDGLVCQSDRFKVTPWRLEKTFTLANGAQASFEVVYLRKIWPDGDSPFLKEEQELMVSVVDLVKAFLERRAGKRALELSEQRFRLLIEHGSDGVVLMDGHGTLTYASPSIQRILGYSDEEYEGRGLMEFVHPDDQPGVQAAYQKMLQSPGEPVPVQLRARHREDGWTWIDAIGRNLLSVPGVYALVINLRDVTRQREAENEVRQSREWFKALFEASRDGIVVEKNETIVFANSAFARLYGYASSEDLIGKHVSIVQSDEDNERMLDFGRRRLAGETVPSMYEFLGKTRTGDPIDVEASVSTTVIGDTTYIISTLRDIRDRKAAEQALEESEQRYREFFDDDLAGNFISTPHGEIIACNPAFAHIFGFQSVDEAMTTNAGILYRSGKEQEDYFELLKSKKTLERLERKMIRRDGTFIDVVANVAGGFDGDGRLLYIKGYILDVTEHKEAIRKLKEQAALLDTARDAIMVVDLNNRVLFWNKSAENVYGWRKEELDGQDILCMLRLGPEQILRIALKEIHSKGEWTGELDVTTKKMASLIVESRWTLVRDENGLPKSILVVNTDITEKKSLEAQFLRTQRLESLGTLAGGIAHDLNNVLGPVLMGTDMLKRRNTDPSILKLLDSMETSVRRGGEMVKQVLAFARGLEGEKVLVQVKHLIDEIGAFVTETFPKSIVIKKTVEPNIPPILGDATQLHQVLLNLSVNARDAMPTGGVMTYELATADLDEHYVHLHAHAKPGKYVTISVQDTGSGIAPNILEKIFDPFFTTKEHGKGTGLGLSTVMGIVRSHSGFVNVYSELGRGTQFRIYLPAVAAAPGAVEADREQKMPRGNGETILVVDDESSVRDVSRLTLEANGYKVVTANDGTEAISAYMENKERVAVVITDMVMPFMDGPATIRALQRLDPSLAIVACSGLFTSTADVERLKPSLRGFLLKPFTASKLLTVIHDALKKPVHSSP